MEIIGFQTTLSCLCDTCSSNSRRTYSPPDVLPPEIDREKHSKKVYGLEKLLKQGQNFTRLKMDDRWIRRRGQMGWYFNKLQFVIVTIFKTIFLMMASRFLSVYQLVHLNWCKNSTTASLQNCSIINWNTVIQSTIWSRGCWNKENAKSYLIF